MKIVYCINSIFKIGGIEKVTIAKANALADNGHKVFIAISDNNSDIPVEVSDKVILKDLKINYYEDDWKSKYNVLKDFLIKRKKHKKKLIQLLNEIQPDIVISVGQCEKYFLPNLKGSWKIIREFHYDRKYRIRTKQSFITFLLAKFITFYEYKFILPKYDIIVTLTEEDRTVNWKSSDNVVVIPNPIDIEEEFSIMETSNKIIGVGRLVYQKNFNSMINCFYNVLKKHDNWILEIYGEGELKDELKEKVKKLGLENKIVFKGIENNRNKIYSEAAFLIMTSKYEGFGLVLIEAMNYGLPTIAYSCPCGPKDIIIDQKTGFLIPLDDENLMVDKICLLIENNELRKKMGKAASDRAKDFRIEKIIQIWINLFNTLLN